MAGMLRGRHVTTDMLAKALSSQLGWCRLENQTDDRRQLRFQSIAVET
jgi:hypothetical protein